MKELQPTVDASVIGVATTTFAPVATATVRPAPQVALDTLERNVQGAAETPELVAWVGRACACWLAAWLAVMVTGTDSAAAARPALPDAILLFIGMALSIRLVREYRLVLGWLTAGLLAAGFAVAAASLRYLLILHGAPASGTFVTEGLLVTVGAVLWERHLERSSIGTRGILVVGATEAAHHLIGALTAAQTPYRLCGVVRGYPNETCFDDLLVLGDLEDVSATISWSEPEVVVVAAERNRIEIFSRLVNEKHPQFTIVEVDEFFAHVFGRLPIRQLSPAWLASTLQLSRRPYGAATERVFDLGVALVALVLTAPILVLVALLVRCTGKQIIFRQVRQGKGGAPFTIYKFRTMIPDAELPGQPVWANERDPRITPVGHLLRQTHLDELPQLWNVLRGEMSIVGPRPERPEYLELLEREVRFWSRRMMIKPGLTGWAQINNGYASDCISTESKLSYDLWYLRHRSLFVDAIICAKTFFRVTVGSR
jgi:exopolysaccharide biosynthesis polyprenyl glycosylphosphotransferase